MSNFCSEECWVRKELTELRFKSKTEETLWAIHNLESEECSCCPDQ